jgi:hypothetical protein
MLEDKLRNATLIKSIGKFLQEVLPSAATTQAPPPPPLRWKPEPPLPQVEQDDGEEDVPEYSFGLTASPYLAPYAHESDSLVKEYGLRNDGDKYRIGNSTVTIDADSNIYIKDKHFKGTEGLWDLLTRKKPNLKNVTTRDYRKYKSILQMTNAHLEQYEPGGSIHVSGASNTETSFPQRGSKSSLKHSWVTY